MVVFIGDARVVAPQGDSRNPCGCRLKALTAACVVTLRFSNIGMAHLSFVGLICTDVVTTWVGTPVCRGRAGGGPYSAPPGL